MLNTIDMETILRNGEIKELVAEIDNRRFIFSHLWRVVRNGDKYTHLRTAINEGRATLDEMELLLNKLNELDGESE